MQVNDVIAARCTGTVPTAFTTTATLARDAAQASAMPNESLTPIPSDIISLSPAAALLCGSALAP